VKSSALTVKDYLASLPIDRRGPVSALRDLVNRHLPKGYREAMAYGMITWSVPLEVCPDTYNGQPLMYAALASQKQAMSLYLLSVYGDPATDKAFRVAFAKAGKKLDMGKSCVRFRSLDALHLPAIADAIASCSLPEFVKRAQAARRPATRKAAGSPATRSGEKPAAKPATKAKPRATAKPARRTAASARDVRASRTKH